MKEYIRPTFAETVAGANRVATERKLRKQRPDVYLISKGWHCETRLGRETWIKRDGELRYVLPMAQALAWENLRE